MQVPYPMVAAVPVPKRHAQMAVALHYADKRGFPRLTRQPIDDTKRITIACYGPSLEQTYQVMERPILSMSGATKWLAEHGVVPDYHVDMDPRPHKVAFIDPPVPGVHYLMASVCHPDTWEILRDQQVTVWHTYSGKDTYSWVEGIDAGENYVIRGGSTIGLTALHVAELMGYRHFEIHGMDGSFNDDSRSKRHAGPHAGTKQQDGITWNAGGKRYQTSRIMANAVKETLGTMQQFPMFCVFHGEGLTQALIREANLPNACCADEREKAAVIRRATADVQVLDLSIANDSNPEHTIGLWDRICGPVSPELITDMTVLQSLNEPRRTLAKYNTGSITAEQMAQLRALCVTQQPTTIIEVGTFIGNSTLAMQAARIYTCDRDNDCLPASSCIVPHPYQGSAQMFRTLLEQQVKADLFFIDGRLGLPPKSDGEMVRKLSHDRTIYVFDDYTDFDPIKKRHAPQKGVINAKMLAAVMGENWVLVEPDPRLTGKSTLAMLVPKELLA